MHKTSCFCLFIAKGQRENTQSTIQPYIVLGTKYSHIRYSSHDVLASLMDSHHSLDQILQLFKLTSLLLGLEKEITLPAEPFPYVSGIIKKKVVKMLFYGLVYVSVDNRL